MSLGKDYIFKSQTKKQLLILFASGILLTIVGIFMIINGDSHHEEVSNLASESSHYEFHWYQRHRLRLDIRDPGSVGYDQLQLYQIRHRLLVQFCQIGIDRLDNLVFERI